LLENQWLALVLDLILESKKSIENPAAVNMRSLFSIICIPKIPHLLLKMRDYIYSCAHIGLVNCGV
jgi:hypothetical protein